MDPRSGTGVAVNLLRRRLYEAAIGVILVAAVWTPAAAEPAFAVRTGYRCSQCHVNRTGGGMRTPFGSIYTQTTLPFRQAPWREGGNLLPANPDARFAVGGDARFQYLNVDLPDGDDVSSFEVTEANLYGLVRLIPNRIELYVDETLGPGGAANRELFALFPLSVARGYVKAGRFLPSYGWRLPDDDAFIRQFTGFSYSNPDEGVEIGFEPGRWSIHLAATNGSGGTSDDNRSKQFSLLTVRRIGRGRIGLSASDNRPDGGRITQTGLLGGVNIGRLALLGEADWREIRSGDETTTGWIGFVEADLLITRGLNLKLAYDWYDPSRQVRTDERTRASLGLEFIPIPFLQLRGFVRRTDGPPQLQGTRANSLELEAHIFF